ncbi:MAG: trypsin-like peptidase domain-containing protein [Casimicrobiaceae bacterium]
MHRSNRARVLARFCAMAAAVPMLAAAAITAVPPATYIPPPAAKSAIAPRPLVQAPAHAIALPAPADKELAALKVRTATGKRAFEKRALAIGIGRNIPAGETAVVGADLVWLPTPDGGQSARIEVRSTGAAGVRVAIAMVKGDVGVMVRFAGAEPATRIFGPYPTLEIAQRTTADGMFWSPVIEGDTAVVELHAEAGVAVDAIRLEVLRLSHLAVAGEGLRTITPKLVSDIGLAGSCEVDVACVANPTQALFNAARSVAKMVFTDPDGTTVTCTGTLINDAATTFAPYFYTASHCIDSQGVAATLNTYWFFDAIACNSKAIPPYVLLTGGAMLLGRSEDYDWSILRLYDAPPAGAQFSAWRAEALETGAAAGTMHHPEGDLKKWSQGTTQGYKTYSDGSTFVQMRWGSGSTEPGSSGAGLFTLSPGGYYELRGALFGGQAACSNPAGIDVFSRFDKALPLMRTYLTPGVPNPNGEVVVVEFYNATLDHYFISSNPAEINDLDTGVHSGWVRTGLRFLAYGDPAQAPAGATPVCRFYLVPSLGDSHFYSGDPNECAQTAARFGASWTFESPSVFWTVLPDRSSGACPTGMQPVFRFFHSARTNHRYTMEVDVRDDLASTPGWIAEGYGPQAAIMCSPLD